MVAGSAPLLTQGHDEHGSQDGRPGGLVLPVRNAKPADGVLRALGRAPRDFAEYARDAAASGIWNETE
ncbi:hypothetical protein [Actinomadura chokoriensis]|uniref:DUF397 domain-containing protein n=1 Tax=Actinomadura chokoriensis TaxID=454156 RepID=A0ABV4R4E9_9ACTN